MRMIKKVRGKDPEVLDLPKDEVFALFYSGMDRKKIYKCYCLVDKFQIVKSEKTFNTSIIFPHTNIENYYNDVYIIKKGLFGVKDIKDKELNELLRLFKYEKKEEKKVEKKD